LLLVAVVDRAVQKTIHLVLVGAEVKPERAVDVVVVELLEGKAERTVEVVMHLAATLLDAEAEVVDIVVVIMVIQQIQMVVVVVEVVVDPVLVHQQLQLTIHQNQVVHLITAIVMLVVHKLLVVLVH
jgi:hypothetical protein